MKNKWLYGALVMVAPMSVFATQSFDARSLGRAGAGLTLGEFDQALKNPAHVNRRGGSDNFSLGLSLGIIASDKDGLIDDVDDIEDELDKLDNCQLPGFDARCPDSDRIADTMETMDGKRLTVDGGAAVLLGLPNQTLPMSVVFRSSARIGARFNYDEDDRAELNRADDGNPLTQFREENLKSTIDASAFELRELGLMAGHSMSLPGRQQLDLGGTFKLQRINLIEDEQRIGDVDFGDVLDDDNRREHSSANIDVGARLTLGPDQPFSVAATVENLIPQTFNGPQGNEYRLYPLATVAGGYQQGPLQAEVGMELTKRHGFGLLQDSQFVYAGAELALGPYFQVRGGYRSDMQSNIADLFSVGVGVTPFNVVNIDLALMTGEGDTVGVALDLGMRL